MSCTTIKKKAHQETTQIVEPINNILPNIDDIAEDCIYDSLIMVPKSRSNFIKQYSIAKVIIMSS